jgi:hypothetical protein
MTDDLISRLRRALIRGSLGSLASLAVLMACSRRETGSPAAAVNAISHWYWGDEAARRDDFTVKHTAVGALTHHAASVFWAFAFEPLFRPRRRDPSMARLAAESAVSSALACTVDYTITPKRFTPGYEMRLSVPSLAAVYAGFAAGLAVGSLLLARRER